MDGDKVKAERVQPPISRVDVVAPEVGDHVELIEGTVGEALMLMDAAGTLERIDFMLLTLSVSLRIDGKRLSVDDIKALPGHALPKLLELAPQAMDLNHFFARTEDGEEDSAPKS